MLQGAASLQELQRREAPIAKALFSYAHRPSTHLPQKTQLLPLPTHLLPLLLQKDRGGGPVKGVPCNVMFPNDGFGRPRNLPPSLCYTYACFSREVNHKQQSKFVVHDAAGAPDPVSSGTRRRCHSHCTAGDLNWGPEPSHP